MATVLEEVSGPIMVNHRGSTRDANRSEWSVKVRLRIEPAGEPPFETTVRLRFPLGAPPRAGGRVAVRYDPVDPSVLERCDELPADATREDRERGLYHALRAEGKSLDEVITAVAAQRAEE